MVRPMSSTGGRRWSAVAIAKNIGPYLIAALALGWVLRHIDHKKLLTVLHQAPMGWFIAMSAFMLVLNCAADTFAMSAVFRRFGTRVPYKDLYLVRASTYLLAVVNYHVGQAAIVGYLYRVKRVPLMRAGGWILFIIGINVGTLFILASAGAARTSGELQIMRWIPLVCGIGIVVYAMILTIKPRFLAERRILNPLFEMGITGHAYGVLVRLPHIFVLLVWHFASLRMFGVQVTPGAALLYLPAYFAISSLPVNVNGIGVAQLVALFFFMPYVHVPAGTTDPIEFQKAAVTAYSLATSGISILLQVVLGLVCLRWATARGLKAEPVEAVAEAAAG
ncbi:MAG: hypothetical protein JWN44_6445 [Myxococcales bacterium]|nr:hypothetical protein [Myxococcales bacterium]